MTGRIRIRVNPWLLLLMGLMLPALAPLWLPGYPFDAHDGRHSVFYQVMFHASLLDGEWWPRWAMHHNQGMGYPTFLIQAPLGHYLSELFVLLGGGFTLAAKSAWTMGTLAGGLGIYQLTRHWLRSDRPDGAAWAGDQSAARWPDGVAAAGVVAGVAYTYFPYHLAGIYVRGALNDTLLLMWVPWLFLAWDRLLTPDVPADWRRRAALALLAVAATLLTHTFALLSIAPLLVTFVLFKLGLAWWRSARFPLAQTGLAALAGVGGLAMTAIFLFPLLAEGRYLQQQVFVGNTYDFHNHFVQLSQFFSPVWGFGYSDDPAGANDGMGFQVGLFLMLGVLSAGWAIARSRRARAEQIYLLAAGVTLLLVMTPLARALWEAIPALAVIQFPWRLLSLAGFLFSALSGLLFWNLAMVAPPVGNELPAMASPAGENPLAGLLLVSCFALATGLPYVQARLQPVEPWREDGRAVFRFEQEHPDMFGYTQWVTEPFTATVLTGQYASDEYVEPTVDPTYLRRLEIVAGQGRIVDGYSRGSSTGGQLVMQTPGTVKINTFWFPGWAATVNGQPAAIRPGEPTGAMLVDVPAGEVQLDLRFGTTPPRTAGALVSGLMVLVVAGLFLWPSRRKAAGVSLAGEAV